MRLVEDYEVLKIDQLNIIFKSLRIKIRLYN